MTNTSTAPAPAAQGTTPEHRWSPDAIWTPWEGNGALPMLTAYCTRTGCGITELAHRRAPSPCHGSDDQIVMTYQGDEVGAVIASVESGFELRWTDYVANDWTEPYSSLSAAVARLATLIYCLEADPERMFITDQPDQFAAIAARFHRANTAVPGVTSPDDTESS